jgi:hypothetical protein
MFLLFWSGRSFAERSIPELNGAADAEFAHAGLQRGAFHSQDRGGASRASDAPFRLTQSAQNVLALGFFQGGDRGR